LLVPLVILSVLIGLDLMESRRTVVTA
jgi:hypothetical protein